MFQRVFAYFQKNRNDIYESLLLVPTFSLYAILNQYVVSCVETEGPSMKPTFNDSNIALVDRFYYKMVGLKKGDIIVATSPIDPKTQICKRILHLPGETKVIETEVYSEHMKIPENHVWIEGDNKSNSFDSRNHGPLPIELIQGKIVYSLFPWKSLY